MASIYKLTLEDMRIRYQNCYVRLLNPPKGVAEICAIGEEFSSNEDGSAKVKITYFTLDEQNQTKAKKKWVGLTGLDLTRLDTGCVNTSRSVVIFDGHKPENNSKYRTLLPVDTVSLSDPLHNIRDKLGIRIPPHVKDWFMLSSWGADVLSSPEEALAMVDSGEYLARAFSSRFYYAISDKTEDTVLMYMNTVAGRVRDGAVELLGWSSRFKEELQGYGIKCVTGVGL